MRTRQELAINEKYILNSLNNALSLLECFDEENYELTVPELTEKLNITKSTVYRIAYTLWARGYLEKGEQNHQYKLGYKILTLGAVLRKKSNLIQEARPYLKKLMEKTGETIHLAILYDNMSTFIDKIESPKTIQMGSVIGARMPAYSTATGKMLLAGLTDQELKQYLQTVVFNKLTPTTITDPQKLAEEIENIRRRGYSIDNEESEEGLMCVSAPLKNSKGKIIAAISISGPISRLKKRKQNNLEEIKKMAKEISSIIS